MKNSYVGGVKLDDYIMVPLIAVGNAAISITRDVNNPTARLIQLGKFGFSASGIFTFNKKGEGTNNIHFDLIQLLLPLDFSDLTNETY